MPLAPGSSTRILGYLAASVALLLGVWLVLPGEPPPAPPVVEEPVIAAASANLPEANLDTTRRAFTVLDEDEYRAAAAGLPDDDVEARLRARATRPPPPPPDPAIMAAQDALLAAYPVASQGLADELQARRPELARACWKKGAAPSGTLYVMATFGPDGSLRDHSVGDDGSIPGVADCVRARIASLKISPPGVELSTRARLELP